MKKLEIKVVTNVISPKQIIVSWSHPTGTSGVQISHYEIRRRTIGSYFWQLIATVPGSCTKITDTDVMKNADYEYEVKSF